MLKKITSCFIGLILLLSLQLIPAQAAIQYIPIEKVRASFTTSPTQPVGYLIDNDSATYWGFKADSTSAQAELFLGQKTLIYGLDLTGYLAPGTDLTVEYEHEGQWFPFLASLQRALPDNGLIDLSYDRVVTSKLRLCLQGIGVSASRLSEVKVLGEDPASLRRRITPQTVSSTSDTMAYAPAEHLIDGNTYTVWQVKPGTTQGEVLFRFDQEYTIEKLKLYLTERTQGEIKLETITEKKRQPIATLSVNDKQGWQEIDLAEPVTIGQIRLIMTGAIESLSEVEFWGYGPYTGDQHYPIAAIYPQVVDKDLNLEFMISEDYGSYTPVTSLKVLYKSTNPSLVTNSIQHQVRLVNNGQTPIDLSTVKLKYWYSKEPTSSERAQVYWATVGNHNITTDFVSSENATPDADYCLVIGFTKKVGILGPGATTEIQLGFNTTDWVNYNQGNDYSFLAQSSTFTENLNYPAYIGENLLAWGNEPAGSEEQLQELNSIRNITANNTNGEPFILSSTPSVRLLYKTNNSNSKTSSIQHHLRLVNTGQTEINLAKMKLRYWYTNEPYKPQIANIYWASCGQNNVTSQFIPLTEPTSNANHYLELGFKSQAGKLAPGNSVEVQLGFNTTDWSNYNQENDYSFNHTAQNFKENQKYTVYQNNKLCWGKEPKNRPQITAGQREEYRLELAFLGESTMPVTVEMNGETLSLTPSLILRGQTIYSYPLPTEKLWEEHNFLRIKAIGETRTLTGARISKRNEGGEQEINSNGLTDRLLLTSAGNNPEEYITFPEKILLEKITVFGEEGFYVYLEVKDGENWVNLTPTIEEEGKFTFTHSIITNEIRVRSSGAETLNEVKIVGSPITDQAPTIKILWPKNEEELDLTGWGNKELSGLVDNPASEIYVNGVKANHYGHHFTVKLPHLGLKPWETNKIIVSAKDQQGRESNKEILVSLGKSGDFSIDQPDQLVYTDQSTFRISGRIQQPKYLVEVNDVPVPVTNRSFSTEVPLVEGLNQIKITYTDQHKGFSRTYYRQVVKQTGQIRLTINQPQTEIYTADQTITVTGLAIGVGQIKVTVNSKGALVNAGFYRSEVSLVEGKNQIIVKAIDQRGMTAESEVIVIRDSSPPVLTEVSPEQGYISSSKLVNISGRIIDQNPISVYVDGKAAFINGDIFSKKITYPDGPSEIQIYAQDLAGNSSIYTIKILVDTTPPESFTVTADPVGWTNNPQPILTFGTTDATSGISHYELAVNNGEFIRVESPYQLALQPDGEHNITIKAVDLAGWTTIASIKIYIDTTPPAIPEGFEAISGIDKAILKWSNPPEEVIGYKIYRNPAFPENKEKELWFATSGGVITQFIDYEVEIGDNYAYTLQAIDHAHNLSTLTEEQSVLVGITVNEVNPDESKSIKFDQCEIILPTQTLPDCSQIVIAEMPIELPENNYGVPVSPIYSATVFDENNNEVSSEFLEPVTLVFDYQDFPLPAGYKAGDLGIYWFHEENGRWEKLDNAWNNTTEKKIYVEVKHFSEYQVMASKYASPSLHSYYELGVSPYQSFFNDHVENVSTNSGSLTVSATDLRLPGRDGFDLILKRVYDSSAAQQEKLIETNDEAFNKAPIDTFGIGWSLNLPWIEFTDKGTFLRLPEGQTIKIEMENNFFEYHEGNHFELKQEVDESKENRHFLFWSWKVTIKKVTKYILIFKDGTQFEFDLQGRPTQKKSPSGKNNISYFYEKERMLKKIVDSVDREILFTYKTITIETDEEDDDGDKITIIKQVIEKITVDNRSIEFNYDAEGLLISVKDPENRETKYQYNTSFDCKEGLYRPDEYTVHLLDQITYPTGGQSLYTYEQLDQNSSESDTDYYGSKLIVTQHKLLGKITDYRYEFLQQTGSLGSGNFIPANSYISNSTITVREDNSGNLKGGKIITENFQHLVGDQLLSKIPRYNSLEYKGSLLTSRQITQEDASGDKKEYETVEYEYDLLIRAITKERYKRDFTIYEITYTYDEYDDISPFAGTRWGNLTSRIDERTKLEETYTYQDHSQIRNLVETKTVKNWNELTKEYSEVTTSYDYDLKLGKPLSKTVTSDEKVLTTSFTYDDYGNLETKTEPNNLLTKIIYDEKSAFPVEKQNIGVLDADGQPLETISTKYNYSLATGMKQWEEDPRGYRTYYHYDRLNRITKVILPDDDQDSNNNPYRQYIFDDTNNTCEYYNENRQKTVFEFDELGRLTKIIKHSTLFPELKTEYIYDKLGRIIKVIDPRKIATTYEYDYLDRVTKINYPDKSYIRLDYNDLTNTIAIYEQEILIAKERSDWSGRLVEAEQFCHYEGSDEIYNWSFVYDANGNKIRQLNPFIAINEFENQTDYHFDGLGRMVHKQLPSAALVVSERSEPQFMRPELEYQYDLMGNKIKETDSRGNETSFEYDLLNRLIKTITETTDGFGQKTKTMTKHYYDPAGNKIRTVIIDAAKPNTPYRESTYSYSARGFLLSEDIVLSWNNNGEAVSKQNVARYRYDAMGNKIATIDPRNSYDAPVTWYRWKNNRPVTYDPRSQGERAYTTWYLYNDLNQLYRTVLPDETPPANPFAPEVNYDNLYTESTFDENGNIKEKKDASGLKTSYTYTTRNWIEEVRINGKLKEKYFYDHRGNKTEVRSVAETADVLDKVVKYKYDSLGQLRQVNYPIGEERFTYDSVGNRITVTDGRNNTTRYTYNSLGWLTAVRDPLYNITEYQYDPNGNQVTKIAANNLKTKGQYDELNRLIKKTDSLNNETFYSYDPVGNRSRIEDPQGTSWEYEYLPTNLLQTMTLTGKEGETYSVNYDYDQAGNRILAADDYNTINYQPDALNRITAINRRFDGAAYDTAYRYENNLLTGIGYPGSDTYLEYRYNDRNLIENVVGFTSDITYHEDGTLKELRYTNNVLATYEYDQNRRLKNLNVTNNSEDILRQHYEFDLVGNITKINDRSYEYDANNH